LLSFSRGLENGSTLRVRFTDRQDGDVNSEVAFLEEREHWAVTEQVHGASVATVSSGGHLDMAKADCLFTEATSVICVIKTADCVPITMYGGSCFVAVHAGWRGLASGVIGAAANIFKERKCNPRAIIGPHIKVDEYEFGNSDLKRLGEEFGMHLIGATAAGFPALDLSSWVFSELEKSGVQVDHNVDRCTSAGERYFSYRKNGDIGRMAMLTEIEPRP
jgi:polyphenol oxidase